MKKVLRLLNSSVKKDIKEDVNYRAHVAISIISLTFFLFVIFFFSNQFISNDLVSNRISTFLFLLSGITMMELTFTVASAIPSNLRKLQVYGILEELMQSRKPIWILLVASSTYQIIKSSLKFFAYYLAAIIFFNFEFYSLNHIATFFLIVMLTIFSTLGIGVIGGGITLLLRKPNIFNSAYTYTSIIFGGIFFSTSILPFNLGIISNIFPIFHSIEAIRIVFNQEFFQVNDLFIKLIFITFLGFIYWAIALKFLKITISKIKKDGSFYEY